MAETPEERLANTYSIEAFAAGIKAKYPQYKDLEDKELVGSMLEKYPKYRESVNYHADVELADRLKKFDESNKQAEIPEPSNEAPEEVAPDSNKKKESMESPSTSEVAPSPSELPTNNQEVEAVSEDRKPVDFVTSVANTAKNIGLQLSTWDDKLDILTTETFEAVLGKEMAESWFNWTSENLWGEDLKTTRNNAIAELEKAEAEYGETRGFIESAKSGDVVGLAAATVDAVGSLATSVLEGSILFGAPLAIDIVGGSIASYNSEKADTLGISTQELYESGQADFAFPVAIGGISYGLEKFGQAKLVKDLKREFLTKTGTKEAAKFAAESRLGKLFMSNPNREGMTELTQSMIESYGLADARGESFNVGDYLTSEEAWETYLMGAVGAGVVDAGLSARKKYKKVYSEGKTETAEEKEGWRQEIINAEEAIQDPETPAEEKQILRDRQKEVAKKYKKKLEEEVEEIKQYSEEDQEEIVVLDAKIRKVKGTLKRKNLKEGTRAALAASLQDLTNEKKAIEDKYEGKVKKGAEIKAEEAPVEQTPEQTEETVQTQSDEATVEAPTEESVEPETQQTEEQPVVQTQEVELDGEAYVVSQDGTITKKSTGRNLKAGSVNYKKVQAAAPKIKTPKAEIPTAEQEAKAKIPEEKFESKEYEYNGKKYTVYQNGTITNEAGKEIKPTGKIGKAVINMAEQDTPAPKVEEQKAPAKKENKKKVTKTKEEKVTEEKKSKELEKKIEEQKIVDEIAPRKKYSKIGVKLIRTDKGYRGVLEKKDKRTDKTTRYEVDIFVNTKTKNVSHTITEFVDGKQKGEAKTYDTIKSFRDAINKKVKAGAKEPDNFLREYESKTKTQGQPEGNRVVEFDEGKKKSTKNTTTVSEITYDKDNGQFVKLKLIVRQGARQKGTAYATVETSDGKRRTFSTKNELEQYRRNLARRKNIKENIISQIESDKDQNAVFEKQLKTDSNVAPVTKGEVKKVAAKKQRPKTTKTPYKFWTYAQVPNEKPILGITDGNGERRLFQLTFGKDGKMNYYEVEEVVLGGGVKRYNIVEGAKPLKNKQEVQKSLREENKDNEPTPPPSKEPAPKEGKKETPKKAVKPPMNAPKKSEIDAKVAEAEKRRAMNKDVVVLDGKKYNVYEDGVIVNTDTDREIKPTSVTGKKVLKELDSKKEPKKKVQGVDQKIEFEPSEGESIVFYTRNVGDKTFYEKTDTRAGVSPSSQLTVYDTKEKWEAAVERARKKNKLVSERKSGQENQDLVDAATAYTEAENKSGKRFTTEEREAASKSLREGKMYNLSEKAFEPTTEEEVNSMSFEELNEAYSGAFSVFVNERFLSKLIDEYVTKSKNTKRKLLLWYQKYVDPSFKQYNFKGYETPVRDLMPLSERLDYLLQDGAAGLSVRAVGKDIANLREGFKKAGLDLDEVARDWYIKNELNNKERSSLAVRIKDRDFVAKNKRGLNKTFLKNTVKEANRILKKLAPSVNFIVHETDADFKEAMNRNSRNGANERSREGGRYIYNKNTGAREIHINLDYASATTAVHEVFHAFYDTAYGQDPELAKNLAKVLYSALRRGTKEDRIISSKLADFIKRYDSEVQGEEFLAELAGIMSQAQNTLRKPTLQKLSDLIKKFLIKAAKRLKVDNEFVQYMKYSLAVNQTQDEAVEFMRSFVNAATDSSLDPTESKIDAPLYKYQEFDLESRVKDMSELTSDYKGEIGGFLVDFYQNTKVVKQAIKNKQITFGHDMSEFDDNMLMMHQPDNAAVNVIKNKKGDIIAQGLGGFLFPMRFKGSYWASTRSAAVGMASNINAMVRLNGKARMVLTAAPADKLLSSTVAARNIQSIVNNYMDELGWSDKKKLQYQKQRYDLLTRDALIKHFQNGSKKVAEGGKPSKEYRQTKALFYAMAEQGLLEIRKNKDGSEKIIKKKFKTSEEYDKMFFNVKDADASVFDSRKEIASQSANALSKVLSDKDKKKMKEFGYEKSTKKELLENMQTMMSEPYLNGVETGMAYAVIEVDGEVEAVEMKGDDAHPSYPFQIVLKDKSKSVKIKMLSKPQNPYTDASYYDISKATNFELGKHLKDKDSKKSMDKFNKLKSVVYPTSGVSQILIRNANKNTINKVESEIYQKLDGIKDINSFKKAREERRAEYQKKVADVERSQLTPDEEAAFEAHAAKPKEKLANRLKSRKGILKLLTELGETLNRGALTYTEEQKKVREFLESMNSQLSRTAFGVRKMAKALRKLTKTPESLKLVNDYMVEADNAKKAELREEILKLEKGDKIISVADAMRAKVDSLSETFLNDPMFDMLPETGFKEVVEYKTKNKKGEEVTKYKVVNTKTGGTIQADLTEAAAKKIADSKGIKDVIRENLGSYMHTSYKFFRSKDYNITDKAKNKAYKTEYEVAKMNKLKELIEGGMSEQEALDNLRNADTINQLMDEAKQSIDKYINEIEELRKKPDYVFTGLSASSIKIPKTALQQKKGIPDHIAELLGKEQDPINKFIDTAMTMSKTIFKTQMVEKISKEFGGDFVKDELTEAEFNSGEWKRVEDKYSPINGKYVQSDIFEMLQSSPILQSENAIFDTYFKSLKLMRKSKVVWNLPTWRKNLTGGVFFIAANGILNRSFAKDLKRRVELVAKGESDPLVEQLLNEMAELGLIGTDVNAGLIDLNDAALNMMFDEDINGAEATTKKAWTKAKNLDAKLAEKYSAIDDYTKLIIYRVEKQSFAKKLYGKEYDSLTESQQKKVREAAGEFIKQNTPTFSRLPKWYINTFSKVPLGDFLGFKLEAWRSITSNIKNAVEDIKKSKDSSLSEAQRAEYKSSGTRRLFGSVATLGARVVIPAVLTSLFLDDDDEEIAEDALAIRPSWMEGHSLVVKSIDDDGNVSVYNYSMEDPYGEITDALSGDFSGFADFLNPNMFVKLAVHLAEGKDAYGRDLYDSSDPAMYKFAKTLKYTTKSVIVPPSIASSVKYQENQMLIRDYKYNLGQQFYFSAREYTKGTPYYELKGNARKNRITALDDVKRMYEAVMNVATSKQNTKMMLDATKVLRRFDRVERAYIQGGVLVE